MAENDFPIQAMDASYLVGMDFGVALHHPDSHDGSVTTYRDFKGVQEALAVAVGQEPNSKFRFIRDISMVVYQPVGFAQARN